MKQSLELVSIGATEAAGSRLAKKRQRAGALQDASRNSMAVGEIRLDLVTKPLSSIIKSLLAKAEKTLVVRSGNANINFVVIGVGQRRIRDRAPACGSQLRRGLQYRLTCPDGPMQDEQTQALVQITGNCRSRQQTKLQGKLSGIKDRGLRRKIKLHKIGERWLCHSTS